MPQDKKPLGLKKPRASSDNTRVVKVIKDPKAGPNFSELNQDTNLVYYSKKSKLDSKDTADYKEGYKVGASNAKRGEVSNPDKSGNPRLTLYPFRGMGSGFVSKQFGYPESKSYAEGRLEGEKRYLNKNKKK